MQKSYYKVRIFYTYIRFNHGVNKNSIFEYVASRNWVGEKDALKEM